ncbi:MAG: tetratricopeptide repeat protein, partial [Anaerolineales bacterium]|nr:tetratricopeptide repeat protein [Anaerolineales bacterium]
QHRVANAWLQYHILRSRAQDGVELFTAAIAVLGAGPDDSAQLALRLRLHVGAARMYGRLNQTAQVVSHVEAVIGLNPGPEHVDELARAYLFWGLSLQDVGAYAEADQAMLRGLAEAQAANANHLEADFYRGLGNSASYQGDLPGSRHYWELSLQHLDKQASPRGMAATLGNLAEACTQSGEFDQARRYFGQAIELFELIHDQSSWARCLNMLARAELLQGDVAAGASHYAAANEYLTEANETQFALDSAHGLLEAALLTGAYDQAAQLLADIEKQTTIRPGQQAALQVLQGRYFMLLGRYAEAQAELTAALTLTDDIFVLQTEFLAALVAWRLDDLATATATIERCLATARDENRGLELAQFNWLVGQMKLYAGEPAAAVNALAEAADWSRRQGVTPLWLQSSATLSLVELELGHEKQAGEILAGVLAALAVGEPAGLPDPFLFYEQLLQVMASLQPARVSVIRAAAQQQFRAQQALISGHHAQQRFLHADSSRQFVMREPL